MAKETDYKTPRRKKSRWVRTDGLKRSQVIEYGDVPNIQMAANRKAFLYTETFQIQQI